MVGSMTIPRRRAISALAFLPIILNTAAASSLDAPLINLGIRFEQLAASLDSTEFSEKNIEEFDAIIKSMIGIPARTIDGLLVKAKAASWALFGDVDPDVNGTLPDQMAMGIVRDLILMRAPNLYCPGAMANLVASCTQSEVGC